LKRGEEREKRTRVVVVPPQIQGEEKERKTKATT
jgi:hypothetical protein